MKHQCFTSLLGEKASRRLHATPLATCRHSSSLRDSISSTGRHTSTSTMDVRSSLVERERLWRHLVARERGRELLEWGRKRNSYHQLSSHLPFISSPSLSPSLFPSHIIFTVPVWKKGQQSRPSFSDFVDGHVTHTDCGTCIVHLVADLLTEMWFSLVSVLIRLLIQIVSLVV